jgi:prevent-host-death family protein
MSDKMSDMSVSVRELQQNLKAVLERVERGEAIEVTRHRRLVARLLPPEEVGQARPWPDLEARTREVFGRRLVSVPASSIVIDGRGDR